MMSTTALLDKLAADNGGVADYVEPKEDLEVKVSNFFAKINSPVLTDLQLDMAGIETDLTYPRAMPDLFRGSQVILIGRYRNQTEMDVRVLLNGKAGTTPKRFFYNNLRFPVREDANDFLPRLWRPPRRWLMEQIRTNGSNRNWCRVVDRGNGYGIVTPISYLGGTKRACAGREQNEESNFRRPWRSSQKCASSFDCAASSRRKSSIRRGCGAAEQTRARTAGSRAGGEGRIVDNQNCRREDVLSA